MGTLLDDHEVSGYNVCLIFCYQEGCYPLGEELPAVEGEDPAKVRTVPGPVCLVLLLVQDGQVQVVRGTALLLTTYNRRDDISKPNLLSVQLVPVH